MAEQTSRDVVEQTQSGGDLSSSDVHATTTNNQFKKGDDVAGFLAKDGTLSDGIVSRSQSANRTENIQIHGDLINGVKNPGQHTDDITPTTEASLSKSPSRDGPQMRDDSMLEDGGARSDTDGSRAGSVTGDGKGQELLKPLKRFSTSKPVSFAKYSVPGKTAIANGPVRPVAEKVTAPSSSASSIQLSGRPRLVAKTTSSLQQQAKPYKSTAPDPMQVWNKNRVQPQPSTKHLTDEELKQQYGIHMTSRMQDDGEGKEAKWADIDDDEDDWAPTTIEWNDGTKSTVAPAEVLPTIEKKDKADVESIDRPKPPQPSKILTSQFTSSVGPNATVLKLGAGRQQAQKSVAQQTNGSAIERPPSAGTRTNLAPPPMKSPWAPLPPVDKVSPITITPQSSMPPPPQRFPSSTNYNAGPVPMAAPSPAKEISADDFSRSWRENTSNQSRELYMPNSGKYEAVPESRRRMSKNEQNFRKPAVLQRPTQGDFHAPAEPSAAFQTSRTSIDQARRRASSSLSGGSAPFARRTSITRSSEAAPVFIDGSTNRRDSMRPESREGPPSQVQSPTYQARVGPSYFGTGAEQVQPIENDIEASRIQQRLMMKEKIEQARRRKQEEEAKLEAEKQERIKAKLASLGPIPQAEKSKTEEPNAAAAPEPSSTSSGTAQSPPKPPLPLATGAPQQYGMMKVHPMDSIKKPVHSASQHSNAENRQLEHAQSDSARFQAHGISNNRANTDSQRQTLQDNGSAGDKSPRPPKTMSIGPEARAGWSDVRSDHRVPQSGNMWGLPNNKTLGNGTFDHGLAGYSPQDLSARNSSFVASGRINSRTAIQEKSPNVQFAGDVSEGRSPLLATIPPDQQSLAANSEADSKQPISRPGPIGPPQSQASSQSWQSSPSVPLATNGITAWNSFQHQASQQERAESERIQREPTLRREEEQRTGIRSGPQYTFNETWKQVQLGDQAGQRQISGISQSKIPPSPIFGAVGTASGQDVVIRGTNGIAARGSRFFPQTTENGAGQNRRAVTYSHPQSPGSPSPPPAEDYASLHPAFDGDYAHPIVNFPREKPVVKLPTGTPLSPALEPATPLSWAARVSQPPAQHLLRAVSTPIAQTPSWQARFDGLLRKQSPSKEIGLPQPVLAVASSSREPLDVILTTISAAVSLPQVIEIDMMEDAGKVTSKDVEDEEDLFEDREAGSLPIVRTPRDGPLILRPRGLHSSALLPSIPIDPLSVRSSLGDISDDLRASASVRILFSGMTEHITKQLARKESSHKHAGPKARLPSTAFSNKPSRNKGLKSRQASETLTQPHQSGTKSRQSSGTHTQSQSSPHGQKSASTIPPSSPLPNGISPSPKTASPASQASGHTRPPRNHVQHGHRGWKAKQPHPQPQTAH